VLIIADENIPYAREAFGTMGEVRLAAGRGLDRNALREADALLVRSVTRVNAPLLEGSRVKFVGTATIGTDHIDLPYLQQKGIAFASAAGCNANSVAEYVVAALLHLAVHREIILEGMTLGIVGAGNVGSRVAEKARALGLKVLLNDPPLAAMLHATRAEALPPNLQENVARLSPSNDLPQFLPLADLRSADVITIHTPLIRTGPHPTFHLFEEARLRTMKTDSILINTARGEVIDNLALKNVLRRGGLSAAILDVWEHEPHVDPELVELTTLATPHIAGYSFDGKLKGTLLIYEALCRFLQVAPHWNYEPLLPSVAQPEILLREEETDRKHSLCEAVRHAYDIAGDDKRLREGVLRADLSKEERGKYFDKLRHAYPARREFENYRVKVIPYRLELCEQLSALGFRILRVKG